jgi:hypothetical protein
VQIWFDHISTLHGYSAGAVNSHFLAYVIKDAPDV